MSNVAEVKNKVVQAKIYSVYDFLEQKKGLIQQALPGTITTDRLIGIFTMILKSSPELMKCSQTSLIAAIIQTVQLGLTPGNIGHVHLIPFNNKKKQPDGTWTTIREVQLLVGYKGLCELVNRSGRASVLSAEVVKSNDLFDYELGLNPRLRHIPATGDRGQPAGAYAIAKNLDANEKVFVYLDQSEIEKVKSSSKAGSSDYSPWNTWPDEMAKKTALKRLCKLLPMSTEIHKKIAADETIKNTIEVDMTEAKDETVWEQTNGKQEPIPETAVEVSQDEFYQPGVVPAT